MASVPADPGFIVAASGLSAEAVPAATAPNDSARVSNYDKAPSFSNYDIVAPSGGGGGVSAPESVPRSEYGAAPKLEAAYGETSFNN